MAVTTGFQGRTFDVPRTGVPCIDLPSRAPCAAADAVFADAKAFLSSSEARQMSESELERELHRRRQDLARKLLQGHRDQRSPKEAAGPAEDTSGVECSEPHEHESHAETTSGTMQVVGLGCARRGHDGLHRLDAALNLLPERYLVEMRRRVTIATASRALRWSRFFGQPAKVYSRALGRHWDDDETAPPVHGGLQETGGARGVAGGPNGAGYRGQARGPSEPGGHLEAAGGRGVGRGVRPRRIARPVGARGDDPRPAREDRRVDDGTGFFSAGVAALSRPARRNLVDRAGALSIRRQCALLGISRSSVYYAPRGESAENLALMRRMDALSLQYPFYGSRQMARHLRREGVAAGRRRVRRLLRLMGLEAIYRKPRTSDAQPDHHVYPYLLRELTIDRPDQVWCADITYIPVTTGFLYLVAIMDWASRHVLSWRLSNTMDSSFCVEALEAALQTGTPGIFNTDQGSQFTSAAFTDRVQAAGARCSMDGRGRCLDNVFIERLWRSLKYEAVYLHELSDGFAAEQVISEWMTFYSDVRPHSALGGCTPAEAYREERAA